MCSTMFLGLSPFAMYGADYGEPQCEVCVDLLAKRQGKSTTKGKSIQTAEGIKEIFF